MVGSLLVGVILKILYIFIRIIEGFMLQSTDKFLKAICQMVLSRILSTFESCYIQLN